MLLGCTNRSEAGNASQCGEPRGPAPADGTLPAEPLPTAPEGPLIARIVLVATLVVSTGLVMLPPTLVSLPLKLMVFVAADGWSLVVRSLLDGARNVAI